MSVPSPTTTASGPASFFAAAPPAYGPPLPAAGAAASPARPKTFRAASDSNAPDEPQAERKSRAPGAPSEPASPRPRAPRPKTPGASRRTRRIGLVYGDNTSEALRYAPRAHDLATAASTEGAAAGHGTLAGARAGAAPAVPEHSWHRWAQALPLPLLPLLGSLPAVANNMRHAQRNVAWWRSFHRLDVRLAQHAARLDPLLPGVTGAPTGPAEDRPSPTRAHLAPAAWSVPLAGARAACDRERAGVRMALNEARYSLAFNAVELTTYLAGALPLALHAAGCGWAGAIATGASHAVPLLLLASGLLHVAQRAGWLTSMVRAKRAASASATLPPALRTALVQDANEGVRFHAVQLGMWTTFCGAMLVTTGALTGAGLLPVGGGVWALSSMLAARVHRLAAARRLEVPEHAVWHRNAHGEDVPGPLHAAAFDDAELQAAALACVQLQAKTIEALRVEVWREHAHGGWSMLARLASALSALPGAATLLGAACGRAFANRGAELSRAVLRAQQTVWQAQRNLLAHRHAALTARLHATDAAYPPPAEIQSFAQGQREALAQALEEASAQQAHVGQSLRDVAPLGVRPDAGASEAWPALRNTWGLAVPRAKVGCGPRGVGELMMHAARGLEDTRCALLWGAGLGCVVSPR